MERFDAPDVTDPSRTYLVRLRIVQVPWFGLYLHRFDRPDPRSTLHDHPWSFVSVVLRGGYVERRLNPLNMQVNEERRVRRANVMRTHDAHAITALLRVPTWTLLLVGPRRRAWGYWEPQPDGWKWTPSDDHVHGEEFNEAVAARARNG